jgi:hypothetical protein
MASFFFYVYALKDPRENPAMPFYIGKGTGSRAFDHLIHPDSTRKYGRILEIQKTGIDPIVDIIVDDITESQAFKIEAELIAAFGTIETGGILTNSIIPSGIGRNARSNIVIPQGCIEKAQLGLELLKDAVFEIARANHDGISNSDAASMLGLRSDYNGKQKDYLSYSLLGLLIREGRIVRDAITKKHRASTH